MTWQINLACCRQCIDPDSCLKTRKEALRIELIKITCSWCGDIKADDGIPQCSTRCFVKEDEYLADVADGNGV